MTVSISASIIIPCYNRSSDLLRLLEVLNTQNRNDFEVVIVDDCSTDPIEEVLKEHTFYFKVKTIRLNHRSGVAKARNTGVAHAGSEIIIFIDSDTIPSTNDWFDTILCKYLSILDKNTDCNESIVLHCSVQGISSTIFGYADTLCTWFVSSGKRCYLVKNHHVPMNNTILSKSLFNKAGKFDMNMRLCEDVEWCFRCHEKGIKLIFIPAAPLYHFDRERPFDVLRHFYHLGFYVPRARLKNPASPFGWLYPDNILLMLLLLFPVSFLKTAYIIKEWLPVNPLVILYMPLILLLNLSCQLGSIYGFRKSRQLA